MLPGQRAWPTALGLTQSGWTTGGHLLLVEKRQCSLLPEKATHKLDCRFLAQAEQAPEGYTDRAQGPQLTPLCPGSQREAEAVPGQPRLKYRDRL